MHSVNCWFNYGRRLLKQKRTDFRQALSKDLTVFLRKNLHSSHQVPVQEISLRNTFQRRMPVTFLRWMGTTFHLTWLLASEGIFHIHDPLINSNNNGVQFP